eukprot:1364979-Amorphochlora_amoeboformis.AAC.1
MVIQKNSDLPRRVGEGCYLGRDLKERKHRGGIMIGHGYGITEGRRIMATLTWVHNARANQPSHLQIGRDIRQTRVAFFLHRALDTPFREKDVGRSGL